jgi:predicted O-methyltransferase YrrM
MQTITKAELGVIGCTVRQYMQPGEQEVLIALIKPFEPRTMVEIGVNIGITAKAVLRHVGSIHHYYGINLDQDYQFELPAQKIERPVHPGLLVKNDPRFKLLLRGDELPLGADVVFIDGDHGRHAVLEDTRWAGGITRPGGLIIWHDYGNPAVEVTGVLNKLAAIGRDIRHVSGTWLAFEHR